MNNIWKLAQECGFDDYELLPMLENFASKLTTSQPAQAEREQLRSAQAGAVMPLIGPLLDAWENADREVMSQEPELSKQLKAINNAMEGASLPTQPAAQATPEWLHLKSYGYAPGNYMSKCLRCGQTPAGLDKRATSCRPCAEAAYADQQATPEPVGEPAAWRWFNSNGDQVTNWLDFKAAQKANVEAQVAEAGGRIEYAYTHPAPGVPEAIKPERDFISSEQLLADESYCEGWNDCRAAMLAAAQAKKGE